MSVSSEDGWKRSFVRGNQPSLKLSLCPPEVVSFVAALMGMTAGHFVLKQTAAMAVQQVPVQLYPKVHGLVRVVGLGGITCLLGCLGLCLALLCAACATAMPTLLREMRIPFLKTACCGLIIFLGCGISGSLFGWTCAMLVTWGLEGFCVFGVIFSLILLFINKWRIVEAPSRMLVLHAVTLVTMFLGVWSGQAMDITKPRVVLVNILLVPASILMGLLVPTFILRKQNKFIVLSFVFLVPLSGLVFGLGTECHRGDKPVIYNTFNTIQFLVYAAEMLTGILGILGGICLSLWDPDRAGRLSFWSSIPAAVILYVLDKDHPHTGLLGVTQQWVGPGGVLGLLSGLAAASGVALGLGIMSAGELCLLVGLKVVGADNDILRLINLRRAAEGGGSRSPCVLVNAAVTLAVLGVVMMGSIVLGVAGFLTAGLGSSGRHGTVLAGIITILKAISLLSNSNV